MLCVDTRNLSLVTQITFHMQIESAVFLLCRTLINIYKVQPMPAIKKVGISLFFILVEYVCDETQRNPPTRQFFTSCIEILGQVSIFSSIVCLTLTLLPADIKCLEPSEACKITSKLLSHSSLSKLCNVHSISDSSGLHACKIKTVYLRCLLSTERCSLLITCYAN